MKNLIILLLLLTLISARSQSVYRSVEGGRVEVIIDTITPLKDLVKRLESDWKFAFTGKGYWIGYTDDMFSIAQYKNEAIPYLLSLLDTTNSIHTRIGALYTLHLIGIDSKIAGRTIEEFTDTAARIEILKYVQDPKLHKTVVSLLMRDPWIMDIDHYMEYLEVAGNDYSYVLSALKRYEFDTKPIGQILPDSLLTMKINVRTDSNGYTDHDIIIALKKNLPIDVIITKSILDTIEITELSKLQKNSSPQYSEEIVDFILFLLTREGLDALYCNFDSQYFYAYKNETLHILGPKEARGIWLDWWDIHGIDYKYQDYNK